MSRRWLGSLFLVLVLIFAGSLSGAEAQEGTPGQPAPFTPGIVWVKLSPAASAEAVKAGEWDSHAVLGRLDETPWVRLAVPEGKEKSSAQALMRRQGVLWAEPEYTVHATADPNDPSFGSLWNMAKIQAPLAWDVSVGSIETIIAVLDTGVDLQHPDLQGNLWQNFGEIAGNGVDDDKNGYVDDRWGWNIVGDGPNPQDNNGHGTHVAGIAGAVGNNATGVTGLMWRCRIMPVKVLDSRGNGSYAGVADGIRYAVRNGARIVNMSLAGSPTSQLLQDVVNEMYADYGVLFVAAAGNCGSGGSSCDGVNPIMYPAALDHVISVAATDAGDGHAPYSEFNEFVDLAAPGSGVYSLAIGGGYRYMAGTSMATPHVAALAGLLKTLNPEWDAETIENHLKATAAKVGTYDYADGRNDYYGAGRIDAGAALWLLDPPALALSEEQLAFHTLSGTGPSVSVTLTNASAGQVRWSARPLSQDSWLVVSPSSGSVSASSPVTFTVGISGSLAPGLYRDTLSLSCDNPYLQGAHPQIRVYALVMDRLHQIRFPFFNVAGAE